MSKTTKVTIEQDPQNPVEQNILAHAITEIAAALNNLQQKGLTFEAVIILAQHNCRMISGRRPTMTEVRAVLESVGELKRRYVR